MSAPRVAAKKHLWISDGDFARVWDEVVREAPFPVPPNLGNRFAIYRDELRRFNERINLIRVAGDREFAARHLLDALAGLGLLPADGHVMDVGSGAGLPGIALAIARPDLRFTLVESIAKKAAFLSHARRALGIDNVSVFAGRFEDADLTGVEAFTARAVADPASLVRLIRTRSASPVIVWTRPESAEITNENDGVNYRLPGEKADRAIVRFRSAK